MQFSTAQKRLLDAAVEVFAEHGFGGTATRDIAARAGRSPAAVYVHHPSKEDLLFAICEYGHRDALACLQAAYDGSSDPVERIHQMVARFSLWHLENLRLARVVQYELQSLTPEHRAEIVALRREFHRLMRTALEAGNRDEIFDVDDVHRTAHSLLSLGIDLVRWFDPGVDPDLNTIATHNADLAVRVVRRSHLPIPLEATQQ